MANLMIPPPQPRAAPAPDVPAATPKIRQNQSSAGVYIRQNSALVGDGGHGCMKIYKWEKLKRKG